MTRLKMRKILMKDKPHRNTSAAKDEVIKEALKDDIVTMTFKTPAKLQQDYKMKCLQNSQSMTNVFIEHIKQYLNTCHYLTQQAKEDHTHWTDEQLDQFKPIDQIPEMKDFVKSRGRPQAEVTKDKVTIRLSREVTEYFRSTGKGWQSKIDKILVDYFSGHN